MIRVTIELIPRGVGPPRRLGTIDIVNDLGGTPTRGSYHATLRDAANRTYRQVRVDNFPRRRLLAFHLLHRVLQDALRPAPRP